MKIVWDANKASANTEKHGVSFEDAQHVLTDPFALTHEDKHATGEQRFVTLGMSGKNQILVVHVPKRGDSPNFRLDCQQTATEILCQTIQMNCTKNTGTMISRMPNRFPKPRI